ncbi:UNVERIFIED_CONTAM: type I glyceraldehyde-3-phosphate dehydrogenase, partial [Salmonella enterica subsp. enterica serovar Weltevreden]
NGFGRIGRHTLRNLLVRQLPNIDIVAINDLTSPSTLAHLLKYDSVHGPFPGEVSHGENFIQVNGRKILILNEKNPADLPWS